MGAGIACLVLGYMLSQFYRAFLAVLAPALERDIGAAPGDLAVSSGLWFLAFALMQPAVGAALDSIGPRRTVAILLAAGGGGGAAIFAMARGPMDLHVAMTLIGIGCSPVLMASYYIFARVYPAGLFATLAGAMIGLGSLGNIAGSVPLAMLAEAVGWRQSMAGFAAVTLVVAAALWFLVRDPPRLETGSGGNGSILDLLRIPRFWAIAALMAVSYAPAASIRGLWAGPYVRDVHGADAEAIGVATLAMGLAMVAGNFAYGPLDRIVGSRKWGVFGGNLLAALALAALAIAPQAGFGTAVALLAAVGFFGASFPAIMAHGRTFMPPHLVGRGVSLLNMFGIGGAGILQFASGPVFRRIADGTDPGAAYAGLFAFFLIPWIVGIALYLTSRNAAA